MRIPHSFAFAACLLAIMIASTGANADVYGQVWLNVPTSATDASVLPAGAPDATFTSPNISYNSNATGYTFGQFLNNPNWLTGGGIAGLSTDNSFILFTGTVYIASDPVLITITHDDGIQFFLANLGPYGYAGITAPMTESFGFVDGVGHWFPFTLAYGECCGEPAVLIATANGQPLGDVPEPASLALLGSGLLGLGGVVRRKLHV